MALMDDQDGDRTRGEAPPIATRRPRKVTPHARVRARIRARAVALELGQKIRESRERRRWTQRALAAKVGITQACQCQLEHGDPGVALEIWLAEAEALGAPIRITYARDPHEDVADAGHLAIQELLLRLARAAGRQRTFELPTRPSDTSLSVDVCVRDDVHRVLQVNECWNTIGNIGAGVRNTRRKINEAEQLAAAIGGERGPYRVAACWIVRDTARNRDLLARYPEVFAATFTGSSAAWVKALKEADAQPPAEIGLVLCDRSATRLLQWRRSG
jgi:DNA-binding XRE family transcriptional regulator